MLLRDILTEMPAAQLLDVEQQVQNMFRPFKVVIHFTSHFEDRSVSGNLDKDGVDRGEQIKAEELLHAFKKVIDNHIETLGSARIPRGVIQDTLTKLNIPFQLLYNEKEDKIHLYLLTIIKTKRFWNTKKDPILR